MRWWRIWISDITFGTEVIMDLRVAQPNSREGEAVCQRTEQKQMKARETRLPVEPDAFLPAPG